MEMQTKELDRFLEAKTKWAKLDEDGDILGVKDDAPDWARELIEAELNSMQSADPVER